MVNRFMKKMKTMIGIGMIHESLKEEFILFFFSMKQSIHIYNINEKDFIIGGYYEEINFSKTPT